MGRGLSELQRAILALAYRNRLDRLEHAKTGDEVYTRGVYSIDLYYAEVLREHFGWEVRGYSWRPERESRPCWGQSFSMREIGERRYRSAQASLSRAVLRLEARGLVERRHHYLAGLDLTERGVDVARSLAEDQPA